ncbi:hypothetical protein CHUAL_000961 [Chamberlinius hualienensis]
MAGAQLTGDVSVGNLNEALDDSCGRRYVGDSYGAVKYSNIRVDQSGKVAEHGKYLPGLIRDEPVVPDIHALRFGLSGSLLQEPVVKDTRSKGENEVIYLRDKVSSLFRENCSLKEQSAKLSIDNRTLQKQAAGLKQENGRLRDKLQHISQQLKSSAQNKELQTHLIPGSHSGLYDLQKTNYDSSKYLFSKDNSGLEPFNVQLAASKLKTANHADSSLTGASSQVTLPLTEPLHDRRTSQLNHVVDGAGFSNEEISQEEEEVLNMLESIQNDSTQIKETILAQNKWLMGRVKNISTAKLKPGNYIAFSF